MMRQGWFALLSLILLLAGCASTPKTKLPPKTGDPIVDGMNAAQFGPERDRVLWQYRTALAAMRRGQFDQAEPLLDAALSRMENSFGPDKDARKSRRYFSSESKKTFLGEPYERVMAYYYRSILYWMKGEPDNARACYRSGQLHDADVVDKKYASDYFLLDYLEALASAKLAGDGADAYARAQKNAHGSTVPPLNPKANVLVFIDYGPGPRKIATGEYGEQLRFRRVDSPVASARLTVDGQSWAMAPYDDLFFQATTRGGRAMDHILANQAVFKSTTSAVGDVSIITGAVLASNHDTQGAGLALLAAGGIAKIISAATLPEADTRTWNNLPLFLSFAALQLEPGDHTLTIEYLSDSHSVLSQLTQSFPVRVPPEGSSVVLYASDQSIIPQNP